MIQVTGWQIEEVTTGIFSRDRVYLHLSVVSKYKGNKPYRTMVVRCGGKRLTLRDNEDEAFSPAEEAGLSD